MSAFGVRCQDDAMTLNIYMCLNVQNDKDSRRCRLIQPTIPEGYGITLKRAGLAVRGHGRIQRGAAYTFNYTDRPPSSAWAEMYPPCPYSIKSFAPAI